MEGFLAVKLGHRSRPHRCAVVLKTYLVAQTHYGARKLLSLTNAFLRVMEITAFVHRNFRTSTLPHIKTTMLAID